MKKTPTAKKTDLVQSRKAGPGKRAVGKPNRHGLPTVSNRENLAALFGLEAESPPVEKSFCEEFSSNQASEGVAFEFVKRYENGEEKGQGSVQPAPKRKLKTQQTPEAELDLHGLRGREAEARTDSFVRASRRKGFKLVLIITGKGLHSPGRLPVLQDAVESRLRELKTEGLVRSHAWEKKIRENSGAILVALT